MIIRRKFPPVYKNVHRNTGAIYFQVVNRRHGMNYRKTFSTEEAALDHARQLEEQFLRHGVQALASRGFSIAARRVHPVHD